MPWLAAMFGGTYQRRILVAIACSIALHEIFAGLVPPFLKAAPPDKETVEHVVIARVKVKPSPTPSPTPTPAPQRVIAVIPNSGVQAKVEVIKRIAAAHVKPPKVIHAKPIWDIVPTPGQGAGAGNRSGAGSLGTGGQGNGTGNQGNGAGAGPCGAVDFEVRGGAILNSTNGMWERNNVNAIVHFADGTAQTVPLDWTWRFKSEDEDPFNPKVDIPMLFQFPPVSQRASEPQLVQHIMRYSRLNGHTILNDQCPNIPPPPTSQP
jgi:hypothetical protein